MPVSHKHNCTEPRVPRTCTYEWAKQFYQHKQLLITSEQDVQDDSQMQAMVSAKMGVNTGCICTKSPWIYIKNINTVLGTDDN